MGRLSGLVLMSRLLAKPSSSLTPPIRIPTSSGLWWAQGLTRSQFTPRSRSGGLICTHALALSQKGIHTAVRTLCMNKFHQALIPMILRFVQEVPYSSIMKDWECLLDLSEPFDQLLSLTRVTLCRIDFNTQNKRLIC